MDSMLPCIRSVIDHRKHHNVIRTSLSHSPNGLCATLLFLPHFDVLLNRIDDAQQHGMYLLTMFLARIS